MQKNFAIPEIVTQGREEQSTNGSSLSLREFADQLSAPLSIVGQSVSYEAARNWENGEYEPNDGFLKVLYFLAPPESWQAQFAIDCWRAKHGYEIWEQEPKDLL
jgi:hypothetical protein